MKWTVYEEIEKIKTYEKIIIKAHQNQDINNILKKYLNEKNLITPRKAINSNPSVSHFPFKGGR